MQEQLLTTDIEILNEVPLERLESEITGFASRLAAATAQWLVWIAAYDRRQGWATWETKSCAHWLNWHCGVSPRTAREHVFIAHKLEEFHQLRQVFLAGELSYSKVRAIARVIVAENEADLIAQARYATASQLDRALGKLASANETSDVTLSDCTFVNNGDGTMTMTLTAPVDEISRTKASVNKTVSKAISREQTNGENRTATIERLGGMKAIKSRSATGLLTGTVDATRGTESSVLVVADIDALTGHDPNAESTIDSQRVDPEVVKRLCCDGRIQPAILEADGTEKACGAETRVVPRRLRRLLERRDHAMCQFPGCESEHRLHAHHVIHWANGGPTELENLISLCHFHHHSVHEGGWNIMAVDNGWQFFDPHGNQHRVPLLRLPTTRPLPATDARPINGAAAPLAGTGERADLNFMADVISTNAEVRRRRFTRT